ncbi:hypothetical protein BDB00DRAFT_873381 [Zychaea mexicana]|uniref:uncharacterized protein n=1 Tax=Zychaea mexicana TaxID=64656 RepID=UPI0022FE13F1|nr:uncharacterized protein BDB00DRAFT_873381 [Zychaea mexicana]KAI9492461.1 hypothetical protein BDB00DRAFT_873381 [Zychaea mexicana]
MAWDLIYFRLAPTPRTTPEEKARLEPQRQVTEEMIDKNVSTGTTFSWQHVNYPVPIIGGSFQILNDVFDNRHSRRPYLLNNEVLLNDIERITGYVEQMDQHQPADTVPEAMQFSAYMRQDASIPKREKNVYVEQIIQLLEMKDIADAQVGDVATGFGISMEERKRLTIAVELVAKPKLVFSDEPTSNLVAQSSYNIVRFLRKLANAGWPVSCTIHQPSAILFECFDHLHLLVHGARTAYYGEIGKGAETVIGYLESSGGPSYVPDTNRAEYILDVVASSSSFGDICSTRNWADFWSNSPNAKALNDELETIHNNADTNPSRKALTYAASVWTQVYLVLKRMSLVYWRSSSYKVGRYITIAGISLFLSFTFFKSLSFVDIQNRVFLFFGAMTLVTMGQPKLVIITFAGVVQTQFSPPRFWSAWMYWLVPIHYVMEGFIVKELQTLPVVPNDNDFFQFTPPTNQTSDEYMERFFATSGSKAILLIQAIPS